jgi:hypothetical protein
MSLAKVAVVCALMALLVSACGIQQKPLAGTPKIEKARAFYGVVDDPRKTHVTCLRSAGLHLREFRTAKQHLPAIQVGSQPSGPTIIFYPTPGIAQGLQIMGQSGGAEVIGSALLYPHRTPAKELKIVEDCTQSGVSG